MSATLFEAFLARIYVDAQARSEFLSDPLGEAQRAGLSLEETRDLQNIDWSGLQLASRSFEKKRQKHLRGKDRFRFSLRRK